MLGVILAVFASIETSSAQSNTEEIDFIQSIFGMEKKTVVAEFLKLDSTDPFWSLYDEYELKRKELGKKRINLLSRYVDNYTTLGNDDYDDIIKNMISLRKSTDKLLDSYYAKVKKVSGSKTAAQFFQIEGYILIEIRSAIMEGIPYIGQFDN